MPDVPAVRGIDDHLVDRVAAVFSDAGPLAGTLPAFERRQAQREMAEAVAGVLQSGGHLLVEAGTGTGKTLAYLIPAILSGCRVLVSTGTKNLQEQIFYKDLALLRDALGVPFTATYMKGRGNYLCLHRLELFRQGGGAAPRLFGESAAEVFLPIIEEWAARTETGDRAELADLPEDLPFWGEIAATSENCIGAECPLHDRCFISRMRTRAAESHLIVVNHHLLCADAALREGALGEVIPECSYIIIDEAHQLEDVATQYFGVAVSSYRADDLVRDAVRLAAAGAAGEQAGELRDAADRVADRVRQFFAAVAAMPVRSAPASETRQRLTRSMTEPLLEDAAALSGALAALQATAALIKPPPPDPERRDTLRVDLAGLAQRAGELRDDLRFVLAAGDRDYVYFLEIRGRGTFLRAAPIDVSSILRRVLFERVRTSVLTSATLTVGGTFDYVRSRVGLDGGASHCLTLPSEFDYRRQALLYLPRRMPDPRSPDFLPAATREIMNILHATRGRAFVLFTSYAAMRAVQTVAGIDLPYPLLVQGTAPRSVLLEQFRSTPNAVLLATSSFWQGVDVMGEALSCVIIDKLPFASPGDPITAARIEAIENRGGQPFDEYQVPLAILTLLQGVGRLIRHRDDRGVLAVLDPRLQTMGYGRRFLDSLPPAVVTRDLGEVTRFFG